MDLLVVGRVDTADDYVAEGVLPSARESREVC